MDAAETRTDGTGPQALTELDRLRLGLAVEKERGARLAVDIARRQILDAEAAHAKARLALSVVSKEIMAAYGIPDGSTVDPETGVVLGKDG